MLHANIFQSNANWNSPLFPAHFSTVLTPPPLNSVWVESSSVPYQHLLGDVFVLPLSLAASGMKLIRIAIHKTVICSEKYEYVMASLYGIMEIIKLHSEVLRALKTFPHPHEEAPFGCHFIFLQIFFPIFVLLYVSMVIFVFNVLQISNSPIKCPLFFFALLMMTILQRLLLLFVKNLKIKLWAPDQIITDATSVFVLQGGSHKVSFTTENNEDFRLWDVSSRLGSERQRRRTLSYMWSSWWVLTQLFA